MSTAGTNKERGTESVGGGRIVEMLSRVVRGGFIEKRTSELTPYVGVKVSELWGRGVQTEGTARVPLFFFFSSKTFLPPACL